VRPHIDVVDNSHLDIARPILEQMEPLEKVLNAEGSSTLSSPSSSAPVKQVVGVSTCEICPIHHKDIDLVWHVLVQEDENNAPFTYVLTNKAMQGSQ
jgi:hypothetical protein